MWPDHLPLFVRISATDWAEGGWSPDESVELARQLGEHGVDLIDVSSGGQVLMRRFRWVLGFQVPFAARIRREAGISTAAVGMITEPQQADGIIANGEADMVLLAREMLRDPYWPLHAASALGETAAGLFSICGRRRRDRRPGLRLSGQRRADVGDCCLIFNRIRCQLKQLLRFLLHFWCKRWPILRLSSESA